MTIRTLLAGAAIASVFAVAPAYAEDLIFMLDNQSSGAISEFYASTTDTNDWEENILTGDPIAAGSFARVTIADGKTICTYDLKIIWEGGEETEERGIDLCATGSYTVTD
jgi:hypothetical protein